MEKKDIKIVNCMVVQSNDLIQLSNWRLNTVPLKIFKTVIACIDTENPPKDNTITIKKLELREFLDFQENYDFIKKNARQLITAIKMTKDNKEIYLPLVRKVIWDKDTDDISFVFEKEVMEFLLVNQRFLQYSATDITNFKTKYGLLLYENLYSRLLQYRYEIQEFIIPVDEIRYFTDTQDKYEEFFNWEKRVLKNGIDDLNNANVRILAKYEKIKYGKQVKDIKFTVRARTSYSEKEYDDIKHIDKLPFDNIKTEKELKKDRKKAYEGSQKVVEKINKEFEDLENIDPNNLPF